MPPISFSEKRNQRPKMPLMAAPASGSRGTSQINLYICPIRPMRPIRPICPWDEWDQWDLYDQSPLHQINLINPDRLAIAIKRDHDAESNRRFGGGHHDNENREHLAGERIAASGVLQITREGDEVQVRRVQNQL